MFRKLLTRLFDSENGSCPLSSQDAELAIAALLVRVARADDRYNESERVRIDRILTRHQGLSMEEAAERRAVAEMVEAEAPDTVRFTRQIKERIALEDRHAVMAAMWEVALADDKRSMNEESLIRLTASLLGINDRDSALARQRVLEEMGVTRD